MVITSSRTNVSKPGLSCLIFSLPFVAVRAARTSARATRALWRDHACRRRGHRGRAARRLGPPTRSRPARHRRPRCPEPRPRRETRAVRRGCPPGGRRPRRRAPEFLPSKMGFTRGLGDVGGSTGVTAVRTGCGFSGDRGVTPVRRLHNAHSAFNSSAKVRSFLASCRRRSRSSSRVPAACRSRTVLVGAVRNRRARGCGSRARPSPEG